MVYRNKVYVSMDADNDIRYYYLMQAWRQSDHTAFNFADAHDINTILDKSELSIKSGLQERLRNTKVFVLLVGESTKYLYKYVRWEIEQALKRELPIIVVNLNGARGQDTARCPALLRDQLAVHINFTSKMLQHALENWPASDKQFRGRREIDSYHYVDSVYRSLGL